MKTDDLINALVADQATLRPPIGRTLALALAAGFLVSLLFFASQIGVRGDAGHAITSSLWFVLKFVVTLGVALPAYVLVRRLARPDGEISGGWPWLLVPVAVLAVWLGYELLDIPAEAWTGMAITANYVQCLTLIPLLSAAPLAAVLYVLRDGAPGQPALAGAFGGLLSGALGATLYATHCSEDSPLFVGLWYPIGIAIMVAAGALLASRLARW